MNQPKRKKTMSQRKESKDLTFWDHVEELRHCLFRILIVALAASVVAFCFKDAIFAVVLAPKDSGFVTYRLFQRLSGDVSQFSLSLINVNLAQQFIVHMKVALYVGLLATSPYIIYVLFGFIAPALYDNEKHFAVRAVTSGYLMFILGVLLNYFLIFPLTVRFLGSYQVSDDVANLISLESFISTLLMLSLTIGLVFELPVLSWLLAKMGVLKSAFMKQYRRHAIVVIVVLAAIITPTADAFTLSLVAIPIYLLFEISVLIVKRVET